MLYTVIRWRINGKWPWEEVELDEKIGKAYWEKYVNPIKNSKKTESKDQKQIQNKSLTPEDTETKWQKNS